MQGLSAVWSPDPKVRGSEAKQKRVSEVSRKLRKTGDRFRIIFLLSVFPEDQHPWRSDVPMKIFISNAGRQRKKHECKIVT